MKEKPDLPDELNYFPDNVAECHKVIAMLLEREKDFESRKAELEKQVRRRNRMIFGKSSAKTPADSLTGSGKDLYNQYKNELDEERRELGLGDDNESPHGGGGRNIPIDGLTEDPKRHTITDEQILACPGCGNLRELFGFNISYQLDILKAVFQNIKHIEYKYSCSKCDGHLLTAKKPPQPIDKGKPTARLVAHVGVAKFDWHQPLTRQERIYLAQSVPVAKSSMCRWLKEGADILDLIVKRMHQLALESRLMQSDSTIMPVIRKGLGKVHKGCMWHYRSEKYIIHDFTEAENGAQPERMLAGFKGVLLTDGAAEFNGVIKGGATRAGCSAHALRYLEDARKENPEQVDYALAIMKSLFDVERIAKHLDERERQALRTRLAKPRLAALRLWLDEQKPYALPKTAFGEAVTYLDNQWDALCFYASTGFVPSHNNASENGLRGTVLGRGNWLFAGSVGGGKTAATWMSIIQTCRLHSIDPFEYITDVLTKLAPLLPCKADDSLDQFLPDRWKQLREESIA